MKRKTTKQPQERGPDGGVIVDFTKQRLGTVVRQWTYRDEKGVERLASSRIERCPSCGKKGERRGSVTLGITEYSHRVEVVMGLFTVTREFCEIDSPFGPMARAWQQVLNGMRRAKAKPTLMQVQVQL